MRVRRGVLQLRRERRRQLRLHLPLPIEGLGCRFRLGGCADGGCDGLRQGGDVGAYERCGVHLEVEDIPQRRSKADGTHRVEHSLLADGVVHDLTECRTVTRHLPVVQRSQHGAVASRKGCTPKLLSGGHHAVLQRPLARLEENAPRYLPRSQTPLQREYLDSTVRLARPFESAAYPKLRSVDVYHSRVRAQRLVGVRNRQA